MAVFIEQGVDLISHDGKLSCNQPSGIAECTVASRQRVGAQGQAVARLGRFPWHRFRLPLRVMAISSLTAARAERT